MRMREPTIPTVDSNLIPKENFYSETMKACDDLLDRFGVDYDSPVQELKLEGFLHEKKDFTSPYINGTIPRIFADSTMIEQFNPCEYFGETFHSWIAQYESLQEAWRDMKNRNKDVFKHNQRHGDDIYYKRFVMEHLPEDESPRLVELRERVADLNRSGLRLRVRDAQCEDVLMRRTPEQWLFRIQSDVSVMVRPQVARLVWWRYFSIRPASLRWTELDDFLSGWDFVRNVEPFEIRDELLTVGFTPSAAELLSKPVIRSNSKNN